MHINVRDILAESVGYNRDYKITGERPTLETLRLTKDIEGDMTITRLDLGLMLRGRITTAVELQCHRCLRTFSRPTTVSFKQVYAADPGDDEFPIENDTIDVVPLIEQELTLDLPIKILCQSDCPGIEITKGPQRGRTKETHHQ